MKFGFNKLLMPVLLYNAGIYQTSLVSTWFCLVAGLINAHPSAVMETKLTGQCVSSQGSSVRPTENTSDLIVPNLTFHLI